MPGTDPALRQIEDNDVCEGALRTQGPILAHDLRHFSLFGDTATKFCDAVFGMCTLPPVVPWQLPFPKDKPDVERVWQSRGREPVKVMHFSDVHIDREYTVSIVFRLVLRPWMRCDRLYMACCIYVRERLTNTP